MDSNGNENKSKKGLRGKRTWLFYTGKTKHEFEDENQAKDFENDNREIITERHEFATKTEKKSLIKREKSKR